MDTRMTDGVWNAERICAARARSGRSAGILDHDVEVTFQIVAYLQGQSVEH